MAKQKSTRPGAGGMAESTLKFAQTVGQMLKPPLKSPAAAGKKKSSPAKAKSPSKK